MITTHQIEALLTGYKPFDDREAQHVARLQEFIRGDRPIADTQHPAGHVTLSGWILNKPGTAALLLHHAGLDIWLQPGGHPEVQDETPEQGATREVSEETGIPREHLTAMQLFDIDVHRIPAKGLMPAHDHFDMRFLFVLGDEEVRINRESKAFAWKECAELAISAPTEGTRRMALKSLHARLHAPISRSNI